MAGLGDSTGKAEMNDLLLSVAEQLKVPLITIARQAELGQVTGSVDISEIVAIQTQADAALTLVDSYLLGLELLREQTSLALEPVSVSSTLVDTAHDLYRYARQYGIKLELDVAGKYAPVMAHPHGLQSALLSLGYALVEAQAVQEDGDRTLLLAAHRTSHGVVAGVYGNYPDVHAEQWHKALELCGRARQPFAALSSGSGAGLFVADAILQAMSTRLRVGRHLKQVGLSTTLQASRQLQFV